MTRRRPPSVRNIVPLCAIAWTFWIVLPAEIRAGPSYDKQRYDGFYNNLIHPDWGAIDSRLIRKVPAAYSDGVYAMAGQDRPSPRKLSDLFMQGDDGLPSVKNRTALFAFFGQLVTSEIIMASESGCPIEFHRIDVDKCDPVFDKECQGNKYIPFLRADYDRQTGRSPNSPREQINKVTSWIDGSFVYSSSEAWANTMRAFENGSLLMEQTRQFPVRNTMRAPLFNHAVPHVMRMLSPERLYLLGDPRTNQHPPLLVLGILFYRYHNVIAARVQREHPGMSEEEVFQKARQMVIGTIQNIILYEYLPALLNEDLPPYTSYKPDLHPGISHIFQSAAFRFGHTLIPSGIYRRDENCQYRKTNTGQPAMRLCSTWWDSNEVLANSTIEELIMGMASQVAEKEDNLLGTDIRNNLFGPMEFSRRDLGALNIMRGRDNGLPDYNTARARFKLAKRKTWNEINPELFNKNPSLLRTLIEIYSNNLNNVDVYIGGMLESKGGPGELFTVIIKEQFLRLRDSDRFWFENEENGIFTRNEIEEIRRITLWDVITNATGIPSDAIQRQVFVWQDGDPCPQPFQLNSTMLEPCVPLQRYDYFEGSEFVYIYACVFLGFVPILCAGAGYGFVKLQNRRRRRLKILQEVIQKRRWPDLRR